MMQSQPPDPRSIALKVGCYVSLLTAALTAGTFIMGVLTPPLSGPFCLASCFEYPYADIAVRFPRDYLWMYPAMVATLLFLAFMVCIHSYASDGRKIFSHMGVTFAIIAAGALIVDYMIQVTVIQPSVVKGEADGVAMLSQFNPHGVFIALEHRTV